MGSIAQPAFKITIFFLLMGWLASGLALAWLTAPVKLPAPAQQTKLALHPLPLAEIPGWAAEPKTKALAAFQISCKKLLRWPDARPMSRSGIGGTAADWKAICKSAMALKAANPASTAAAAQRFFAVKFKAYALDLGGRREGLFTGYYEPTLRGSRTRKPGFQTPLYLRPKDMVAVDLGRFDEKLKGRRLVGKVRRGRLLPYPDRAAINAGALADRGLEIVYVADPIAAFFLHIQGSGRVVLENGQEIGVGYAGQNGHKYVAIGAELIARGHLTRNKVSMQSIRAWLQANPKQRRAIFNSNPSYIFFRETKPSGAVGALGAVLTPGHSLAVDRARLPLAAPLFLVTRTPLPGGKSAPLRRLMVAQDVGGAIKGGIRGDIFFGPGKAAAFKAGHMKASGRLFILLPRHLRP